MQNIDSVVKSIKESENMNDARSKLISKFNLSEKQANAILDMKLGRLTHLEENSLNKQKDGLQKDVSYYTEVVNSPVKIDGIIKEETTDMKKKYGRARRTEIVYTEEPLDIKDEDMISNEKVSVILTNTGYVKKMNMSSYKEQGRGGKGIISINLKEGDYVKQIVTCENKDHLICISNLGRAYWLKAYNIPEGSRYSEGKAIVNLLNLKDENVMVILNIKDFQNSKIAFLTAKGVIKKVDATLFSNPRTNGVRAITLNDGDSIADVIVYSKEQYLLVITKNGKAIRFKESDLRFIGRTAMGVRGIRLSGDDVARNIIAANNAGSVLSVTEKGYGKLTDITKYRVQNRGGGGVINIKVSEKNGRVAKSLFVEGSANVILINSSGVSITVPVASIRITGRSAAGVRLMKLESGTKVVDARIISNLEAPVPMPA
jgi:DNA gyrase subunit A